MKIENVKEFLFSVVSGRMNVSWLINWSHYYMPGAASSTNLYCSRKAGGTAATIYTCIYYVLSSQERSIKRRRQQHEFPQADIRIQRWTIEENIGYQRNIYFQIKRGIFRLCFVQFLLFFYCLANALFVWYKIHSFAWYKKVIT